MVMISKGNVSDLTFFRGRVALYAILKAMGIGKGDEVAMQAFTCLAVPEAILSVGACPIYVDIAPRGFNIDPADLAKKITPRMKAIIVQHTYGIPAEMDTLCLLASNKGIPIIEDCCHTLVGTYNARELGSFGVASFYSFEWGKPLVAGIGGSAIINDPYLIKKVKSGYSGYRMPDLITRLKIEFQYFAFGILYNPSNYWILKDAFHKLSSLGILKSNYNIINRERIPEDFYYVMSNCVKKRLISGLNSVEAFEKHSKYVAEKYREKIISPIFVHPNPVVNSRIVYARYPLLTKNKNVILAKARKANVEISDWYFSPVHPLKIDECSIVDYIVGSCPNAEQRSQEVITLPTNSRVREKDIDRIVNLLNGYKHEASI